jgi:hypothetical protein
MSCPGLGGGEGAIEADTARSVCRGIANDLSRQRDNRFKGHPFRLSTITIVGIGRDGNVIDARGPYRRYSNLRYMRTSLNPLVERQPRRCSTFSAGEAGFARLGFEAPVTDGSRCMRTTLLSGSTVPVADDAKPASGAECITTLALGWQPFCAPRLRLRRGHSACDHRVRGSKNASRGLLPDLLPNSVARAGIGWDEERLGTVKKPKKSVRYTTKQDEAVRRHPYARY